MAIRNIGTYAVIPLPHTGIGFDQNGDPVQLTVNGGVTQGYADEGEGSLWCLDYGCVKRNPELFTGFTTLGNWVDLGDRFYSLNGELYDAMEVPISTKAGYVYEITYTIKESNLAALVLSASGVFGAKIINSSIGEHTITLPALVDGSFFIKSDNPGFIGIIGDISVTLATPKVIPNNPDGQPAYPLVDGDTFIPKGSPLNTSDYFITLFETGDTALAKTFFDKSNIAIWKDPVRASDFYDSDNSGRWHSSEMLMAYLYENVQDAYKYMLWTKEVQEVIKEIFLYPAPLEGDNICKAKKYVVVGETYESAEDAQVICDNDNMED